MPPQPRARSERQRSYRVSTALVCMVTFVGLPLSIYMFATRTAIGPIVYMPRWAPGHGIHLSEAIATVAILPAWLFSLHYLLGALPQIIRRTVGTLSSDDRRSSSDSLR